MMSAGTAGTAGTAAAGAALAAGVGAEAYGLATADAAVKHAHSVPNVITAACGNSALDSRLGGSGNHKAAAAV